MERGQAFDVGDNEENVVKPKKKKHSKYNYAYGDRYPGIGTGHKTCNPLQGVTGYPVPYHMGWLWNATDVPGLKFRRGWRPGALGKSVQKVMTLKAPLDREKDRDPRKKEKKKPKRRGITDGGEAAGDSEQEEPLEPKAALKINRKGDTYTIQVNPLKDLTELRPLEDPYIDCDPLIFKITKQRSPEQRAKMEAKKLMKIKKERDAEIRKQLSEAAEDICRCAYMDVFCNDFSAIDKKIESCPAFVEPPCLCKDESLSSLSSNASWNIDYTPPFGCFDTQPKKIKAVVEVDTQYNLADAGESGKEKSKAKKKKSSVSVKNKKKK